MMPRRELLIPRARKNSGGDGCIQKLLDCIIVGLAKVSNSGRDLVIPEAPSGGGRGEISDGIGEQFVLKLVQEETSGRRQRHRR